MKKKTANLVVSVTALAVLCGAYAGVKVYVSKLEESENAEAEEETTEVYSVASEDIQSLSFLIDGKTVTFEKDGDQWIKSDETEFPVNQDIMTEAAGYLASVEADRVLEDVEDLTEYGLNEAENVITVVTTDGKETTLQVGIENESTGQYYIEKDDDAATVYVVDSTIIEPFTKELYDYAQESTFPVINSTGITRIQVEGSENSYVLAENEEDGLWNVEDEEGADKADSAEASTLTSSVAGLAYDTFVNYNCTDLSEYGLDDPYAVITVDYQEEVEISSEEAEEAETGKTVTEENEAEIEETVTEVEEAETEETVTEGEETEIEETVTEGEEAEIEETGTEVEEAEIEDISEEDTEEETVSAESEDEEMTEISSEESDETAEDDAAESDETTDGDATENTEIEIVESQLILYVGDESSDGGRYVRVGDSNEIYTIDNESISTFTDKSKSDLWDLSVSYVTLNNLDKIQVEYEGETYDIDVSRETSDTDSSAESEADADTEEVTESETDTETAGAANDETDTTTAGSEGDEPDTTSAGAAEDETDTTATATESDGSDTTTVEDEENESDIATDASTDAESSEESDDTMDDTTDGTTYGTVVYSYRLNGNSLDSTLFATFYNKMTNMAGEKRLEEEYETEADPDISVRFIDLGGNEILVDYYEYDTNYYAAVTDGKVYLINKMTAKDLITAFEAVTGKE